MTSLTVTGGTPLRGSVRLGGAKNASFKLMIAALLGTSESRLLNFSQISDVQLVSSIINYLGGSARTAGERALFIDPAGLSSHSIDAKHGEQGRFSTMFIPVLLHTFGRANVPAPGGDKIGKRPLERHFDGLAALGATIIFEDGMYKARAERMVGAEYTFEKNSHTGTETLIMAGVLARGTTVLKNAAREPEIDDLIAFLNAMGGHIKRTADRTIVIEGVKELHGAIHKLLPDRNEAVTYACAALGTKGDVVIENARAKDLHAFLQVLDQMKAGYEVGQYGIRFFYKDELQATKIEPGFMTDWQPLMATLLTQCQGKSTIHETVMDSRFQYVPELQRMGADITLFQPKLGRAENTYNFNLADSTNDLHAIGITGPTPLVATDITIKDLRHGATLITAALIAQGTSHFSAIEHVDRGYEALEERLRSLGAVIQREEGA
ncbi:UDP-N-acetylglucosamine 1-carboxyvinyltransferase [Candidatus Woesebacteria bacterium]|nr:UDP-N-acetylglucosamine 1-carboxyvinyltransferase [Candidatus Woesebacteria bacterium]